jgi:hypothetical protein
MIMEETGREDLKLPECSEELESVCASIISGISFF